MPARWERFRRMVGQRQMPYRGMLTDRLSSCPLPNLSVLPALDAISGDQRQFASVVACFGKFPGRAHRIGQSIWIFTESLE